MQHVQMEVAHKAQSTQTPSVANMSCSQVCDPLPWLCELSSPPFFQSLIKPFSAGSKSARGIPIIPLAIFQPMRAPALLAL